mmetsp:Transcript_48659/g.87678  ORF Transcript_48659/g.87678 Transcript_48659/m.87678 type:complete len:201 (-) Transcript_48659:133-735(-)
MTTIMRSLAEKPNSFIVPSIIDCTAGINFIILAIPAWLGSMSLHSSRMPRSFSLLAGCLKVSRAFVRRLRALSFVSCGGPAGVSALAYPPDLSSSDSFFLVRFQSDLFFEDKHCLSSHASKASLLSCRSRSLPSSQLLTLASRHFSQAAWSFSVQSANCSAVQSGKTICFATVSPLIFTISMMKIRAAAGGIFGGFPLGP